MPLVPGTRRCLIDFMPSTELLLAITPAPVDQQLTKLAFTRALSVAFTPSGGLHPHLLLGRVERKPISAVGDCKKRRIGLGKVYIGIGVELRAFFLLCAVFVNGHRQSTTV